MNGSLSRSSSVAASPAQSQTGRLIWRGITLLLGLGASVMLLLYLVSVWDLRQQAFPGFTLTYTNVVAAGLPSGGVAWPGLEAGIQRQDYVIGINDQDLISDNPMDFAAQRQQYNQIMRSLSPGDTALIRFQRDTARSPLNTSLCEDAAANGIADCAAEITLIQLPDVDLLTYFVLSFVSGVILAGIGWVMVWLRSEQAEGRLAAIVAFMSSLFITGLFDVGSTQRFVPIWILSACWLASALITLGMVFPTRLRILNQRRILTLLPALLATLLGAFGIWRYLNPASAWDHGAAQFTTIFAIAGLVVYLLLLIVHQRPNAATPTTRDQTNSMLIGSAMMLVPAVLWLINRFLLETTSAGFSINFEALMPLYIFPNIAVAYAVLQYRRFDTDRIISQGITYAIMLGALIISIFLITLGTSFIAQDIFQASDPLIIAFILFVMVLLFTPLRTNLQSRIDKLYFRARENYQQRVENFAQKLSSSNNYRDVVARFQQDLEESIAPSAIFIFLSQRADADYVAYEDAKTATDIRFGSDSGVVTLLQARSTDPTISLPPGQAWPHELWPDRSRLTILRASVLAGLPGSERLNGFVIIGPPRSGKGIYDFEEMRFINNMAGQFAIATARALVVDSLEQRVRELDVLSQVGQAVNFTIEFDDLLELINAQTSKLIEAQCFYIALYEESFGQLFFAFFLEDDDRFNEKENVRWELGDDPFSEIVRYSRALRMDDYASELARRTTEKRPETSRLKAWMGVPLSAGSRTLGVIAVGKTDSGESYNDGQFKIFSDIASLAATSIDKARLFTETKIRERQLTVLNDITRRIVATESDVEKLLELIMSSAVEILNAEAGSLLLNAEDGNQDLEFRVVIGGAGAELIGRRIQRGTGIVGEVAQTGRALIVNNAENDPRHVQRFDQKRGFQAHTLLTVPLIAKDSVIGVLQVVNKNDGTIFVEGDATLLNTFASQAAVAIENARLLRMTDMQLAQRVKELETLERIDSELNRTLDLHEVAEITVQSAVSTLKAQAGALGIVNESPPYLEIVALVGYEEADYPEGAEGRYWPLNKGIVSRVMRSRQADIVSDTAIDPDYIPSLPGGISQITLPMLSGDDINAILILEKSETPRFSLPDWAYAQRIAEHASIAIANAQLYAALTVANKSKSEFMGFAAHELKTPLASVKGYADVMLTGMTGALSDQQRNFINIIQANARRMDTLINDLRDSAKMDANEFRVEVSPVNIRNAVIETLRPLLGTMEDKNQSLANDVPDDLPLVMGDETRLIQVLTNLMTNASKYSPPDTQIRIYASIFEDYIDKRGTHRGPMVQISVQDQGLGMSEEDVARLFKERYFRSTNQLALEQPGTGLGMMLTHGIMEKHNGDIWVESTLGNGSTFHIVVPIAPSSEQNRYPEAEPASD